MNGKALKRYRKKRVRIFPLQYTYEEFWRPKDIPVLFRLYQISFKAAPVWRGYWDAARRRYIERGLS